MLATPVILALAASLVAFASEGVREAPPQAPPKAPQLTKAPEIAEPVLAQYPPDKLAAGVEANVDCIIDLSASGTVTAVKVDQGAGPDFDAAAVAAIQKFRFTPAELDGKPAPVRFHYIYRFKVDKKLVEPSPPVEDTNVGKVTGVVREAGTRKPLAGAEIGVQGTDLLAVTDGQGRFALQRVPAGTRRVVAQRAGFAENTARLKVERDGTAEATIYLRPAQVGELSATVTGQKPQDAPTRRSLSKAELKNVPGSLNDPIRAVQNLPGMARSPFLSGALLVRGSPAADTGIYLDGDKIPLLFHFLGGPSILPEPMLERIDFYPGGYGAYYGRNLTGAIDVASRGGEGSGFHGQASIDLIQAAVFVELPFDERTRGAFAVRRSYIDTILPAIINAANTNPASGTTSIVPIYYDYQGRVDHKFEGGDTLSLFAFGSDDNLAVARTGPKLAQPISLDSHIAFHRLHGSWKHALGPALALSVSPAFGYALTSFSFSGTGQGATGGSQSGEIGDWNAGLRSEVKWTPESWLTVRGGVDLLWDRAGITLDVLTTSQLRTVGAAIPVSVHIERIETFLQLGEYVEADLKFGRLQIVPGLRIDQLHSPDNTHLTVDPRLWVRWQATPEDAFKAYAGLYHQPPSGQNLLPDLGNPYLGPAAAGQLGLGYERRFSDLWSANVEGFYNRKWDVVGRVPAVTLADGTVQNLLYDNVTRGRAFGLELMIRREVTAKLYGWLSYTLSRSQVLSPPVAVNAQAKGWQAFQFDQPHILTTVVGWRPSVGWELSSRFRFTSGNPTTPILYASFDADKGTYTPQRGDLGQARSPAFWQLDARAQYTWIWDLFRLTLYLDVQNVTNHKNEEFHLSDYRFREEGSISGLPILPTFGLQGTW